MEIGRKDSLTEWAKKHCPMELHLMAAGLKVKQEVMALKYYQMEQSLKESGKRADFFQESVNSQMVKYMTVSGMKGSQMGLVLKCGLMVDGMKATGIKENQLVKV